MLTRKARSVRFVTWALIAALLACLVYLLASSNAIAMYPAYQWHVDGTVTDQATNALGGVNIVAAGKVNFTLINQCFGTAPRSFHLQTTTDASGHFALAFKGSFFELVCVKSGYKEKRFVFNHLEGQQEPVSQKTDQSLRIFLDPERGALEGKSQDLRE